MLRCRLFFLTCLVCFATSAVLAQDVEKVDRGPETHKWYSTMTKFAWDGRLTRTMWRCTRIRHDTVYYRPIGNKVNGPDRNS